MQIICVNKNKFQHFALNAKIDKAIKSSLKILNKDVTNSEKFDILPKKKE